jgi:predicted Co/Zn/Cd cation transporter (cation efflux family)
VILSAVVATTPLRVVARCRSCLCIVPSVGIYDVVGVAVLSLSTRVNDLLPDRRPALVGRFPCGAAHVDGCLLTLSTAVILHAALMAYVGCRAFDLLHGRLLDDGLRLAVQVTRLKCRGRGAWLGVASLLQ